MGIEGVKCFVCAPKDLNPQSLNLEFIQTEKGAQTRFSLPEIYQSYPGFLHGGILAAILDETMAYAAVFRFEKFPLTRHMKLSFRRGVEAEGSFTCRSELLEWSESGFKARAAISREGRGNYILAEGEFALPTKEQAARIMPGSENSQWSRFFR
jgi:acyl-coenzyme A thioesterase PaaI-like protein